MAELGLSLERMSFLQLLLLLGFVAGYMLALGGLLGARGRWRAAGLAVALAAGFVAVTRPWEHGALLVVFVVGALGLFVLGTWVMARLLAPRLQGATLVAAEGDQMPLSSTSAFDSVPAADSGLPARRTGERRAPKLARRALR